MFYQDNYVITGNAVVLWDGISRPEPLDDGGQKHSLKIAMPASAPEVGELQSILDRELASSEFRGQLPPGALPGMSDTLAGEFGDVLPGHKVINSVTYNGAPDVYDINGQKLDPMHYSSMLYPGATVQVIVSARSYNNKSKGLGFWLNGVKIIDATTPKLPVAGGVDAGAAFGAASGGATAGNTQQPPAAQTVQPQTAAVPSPAAPAPGHSAPPPAPAPEFLTVNGQRYTEQALRDAGWSEEQINAVRQ